MTLVDEESGFNIKLEGKHIIKFDQHRYYIPFSGQSRKGVDYLIINDDHLYLIEIKNFHQYPQTKF